MISQTVLSGINFPLLLQPAPVCSPLQTLGLNTGSKTCECLFIGNPIAISKTLKGSLLNTLWAVLRMSPLKHI